MSAKWSVLAVYQGGAARQCAVKFCDVLVQRFWPDTSFDLDWCRCEDLREADRAKEAATQAEDADIVVVAMAETGTLEPHVHGWLETALVRRGDREGILVGLAATDAALTPEAAATQQYLRKLAHDSGLDYLTRVPQSLCQTVPETVEAWNLRASQMTSVLDTILHRMPPPPRLL